MSGGPLRIALIRQRYRPDGGAERFVSRALAALKDRGAALTLVTREWQKTDAFDVLECDPFYLGNVWRDLSFSRCACRRLTSAEVDLVQSHERVPCCDIYRAGDGVHREWLQQRARAAGALGRLMLRLNPYHYYVKRAERRLFESPRLRAVICNSRMVKEEIKRHFSFPDDKLHVIYSGVDTQRYHPELRRFRASLLSRHGIPAEAFVLLFVGSGFERKGLRVLLEAFPALPSHCHLLVVGRDKHQKRFGALAARLGILPRIHFAGVQRDVLPYYGAADTFVLPTLYDPFPNAALEAMAAGLPIITSLKCGAAELVKNGKNGFVVDALDKTALIESLRALDDAHLRKQCANAARESVQSLDLNSMSEQLISLYKSLLEARVA